jgi:hypothetical protein
MPVLGTFAKRGIVRRRRRAHDEVFSKVRPPNLLPRLETAGAFVCAVTLGSGPEIAPRPLLLKQYREERQNRRHRDGEGDLQPSALHTELDHWQEPQKAPVGPLAVTG